MERVGDPELDRILCIPGIDSLPFTYLQLVWRTVYRHHLFSLSAMEGGTGLVVVTS